MDGTLELKEPLTGPRLTLLGEVQVSPDQAGDKERYLALTRRAAMYAASRLGSPASLFRRLFVAGFGRIFASSRGLRTTVSQSRALRRKNKEFSVCQTKYKFMLNLPYSGYSRWE